MLDVLWAASQYAVYEDTVRQTPGRPEMLANYQALWLLPKVACLHYSSMVDGALHACMARVVVLGFWVLA